MKAIWIEIPVKDLERAMQFYQTVFQLQPTEVMDDGVRRNTILSFSADSDQPGISLNQTSNFEPSATGTLIYLDSGEELSAPLGRVEAAGGTIVAGKSSMGEAGNYAIIHDTEGNALALYSAE